MPALSEEQSGTSPGPSATIRHALRDQDAIWAELRRLADVVETMLHESMRTLREGATELAPQIRAQERSIDRWEVQIERECLRVLTLYEPVATDLRRIAVILKVNGILERISDLASNIVKRTVRLMKDRDAVLLPDSLVQLTFATERAVHGALGALASGDAQAARAVISGDREIDRLYHSVVKEQKEAIRGEPARLTTWLRFINTARNLERVADHATKIAEAVVYLKEGAIVRHHLDDPSHP